MKAEHKPVHACPQCGGAVVRVHRHLGDRLIGMLQSVHRYRCNNADCSWEGIVSTPVVRQTRAGRGVPMWAMRLGWMAIGVAAAMAATGGLKLYRTLTSDAWPPLAQVEAPSPSLAAQGRFDSPALPADDLAGPADIELAAVAPGQSFDGYPLPDGDTRLTENPTGLSIRRGCAWGAPGRSPYTGTVRQALAAARLPDEVVHKIDLMVERGMVSDRLVISKGSIQTTSGKRRFEPNILAMGFGKTLCFGTRVNFEPGHTEFADLYETTDAAGRRFSIMVPYVCRNVSVLAARAERGNGGGNGFRTVPEPASLASVIAALAAMAFVATRFHWRGADRTKQ